MAKQNETSVTFRLFNKDFVAGIKEMDQSAKTLRQELKLEQAQLKNTGTESEKLESQVTGLSKQFDLAKQRTQATAKQLQEAKQRFDENSDGVKQLENQLREAQITEANLGNRLQTTTEQLEKAKQAEAERTSEVTKAKQNLSQLETEEKKLTTTGENLEKQYELERGALSKNATATDKAQLEYAHLQKAQENARKTTQNLENQLEQARKAYGDDSQEVRELEGRLLDAQKAEQDLGKQSDEVGKKVGTAFRTSLSRVQDLSDRLKTTGENITNVGKTASTHITAPIVGAFGLAVKSAAEFEHQLSDVRKEISSQFDSVSDLNNVMDQLSKSSIAWSEQFGQSTTDINAGFLTLVKDGYSAVEALQVMHTSLFVARGANEELSTTVDELGSSLEAYGLKTTDASKTTANFSKLADVMAFVSNHTKASISSLGEAFSAAGSTANASDIPVAQFASAIGIMQSNGIEAERAARALQSGLVNLTKPTKQMKVAMDAMSLSVFDANGNMVDLPTILSQIEKGTDGWTQAQRNNALATVFGKQSLAPWNVLIHKGSGYLSQLSTEADNATGEVENLSNQMQNTPINRFKALQASVSALGVTFGEEVLPYVIPIVKDLQQLVNKFANLNEGTKHVIITMAALAAVIGPVLIIIGSLFRAVGSIVGVSGRLVGAIGKSKTAMTALGTAFNFATGPFGLILRLLNLLLPSIINFVINNEHARNAIVGAWQSVSKALSPVFNAIGNFFKQISPSISNVLSTIGNALSGLGKAIGPTLTSAIGVVSNFITTIVSGLSSAGGKVKGSGNTLSNVFSSIVSTIGNIIKGLSPILQTVVSVITSVFNALLPVISSFLKQFSPVINQIVTSFQPLIPVFKQTGQVISDSLVSLQPSFQQLGEAFGELVSAVGDLFGTILTQLTPVFNELVATVVPALSQALQSIIPVIVNLVTSIVPLLAQVFQSVMPIILQVVQAIIPIIVNIIQTIVPIILNIVQSILPLLVQVIQEVFPVILQIIQAIMPVVVDLIQAIVPIILNIVETVLPLILQVVQQVFPVILQIIQGVMPLIVDIIQVAVTFITTILVPTIKLILEIVQIVFPAIIKVIQTAINIIIDVIHFFTDVLKGNWKGAWNDVKQILSDVWSGIKTIIKAALDVVKTVIKSAWSAIKSVTLAIWNPIKSFFLSTWESIKHGAQSFKSAFISIWNAIKSGVRSAVNPIIGFINSVLGGMENLINSLSRVINKIPSIHLPSWLGGGTFGIPKIPTISLPRIPKLDVGTNEVQKSGLAMIHQGEAVVPKKFNPMLNAQALGRQIAENMFDLRGLTERQVSNGGNNTLQLNIQAGDIILDRRKVGSILWEDVESNKNQNERDQDLFGGVPV